MSDLFINKNVWSMFSKSEMKVYQEKLFKHYRYNGFPYFPVDSNWRLKEYNKLKNYDFRKCLDKKNRSIKQSMHGLSLCWSYHPYHYEIQCNNMRTVMETFENDNLLKEVIAKRIKMGDNMSDNGLRKMIKIFSGTQCVSNFRPTAAASIYSIFCKSNEIVFDMSAGFGGRCLGAHIAGVKYIGVDPSSRTCFGLNNMIKDFNINAKIYNIGSEYKLPIKSNSIDFCFTSPPYFNCEKYSEEATQSYIKYPTKKEWINKYIHNTFKNCYRILKQNKYMAINIQNVKSYKTLVEDVENKAIELGFKKKKGLNLILSNLGKEVYKKEPILVFIKE